RVVNRGCAKLRAADGVQPVAQLWRQKSPRRRDTWILRKDLPSRHLQPCSDIDRAPQLLPSFDRRRLAGSDLLDEGPVADERSQLALRSRLAALGGPAQIVQR